MCPPFGSVGCLRVILHANLPFSFCLASRIGGWGGGGRRAIPARCVGAVRGVMERAEQVFARLAEVAQRYAPHAALGTVDVGALVDAHVRTSDDFSANCKVRHVHGAARGTEGHSAW